MKLPFKLLIIVIIFIAAWLIFSYTQPAIIIGESKHWKAVYKPRKGDEADSIAYPWTGKIKWQDKSTEPHIQAVDSLVDNVYVNELDKDSAKKGNGNFNGRVISDPETFYDGPDKSIQGMRITWKIDGKKHTETFKFKRKKRWFVLPLF